MVNIPNPTPRQTSFPKEQIKVLLLENIHPLARNLFANESYQVETLPNALNEEQLKEKLADVHILGIRSKTQITEPALREAKRLLGLGCFCIGTNQVDLTAARRLGIPVFNAPFGNTRSVAEMVLSEIIMLARQLGQRNNELHKGIWRKVAVGCYEVRGKTLGIVGYGHIGSQVSTLAEALGMRVIFFDIVSKLPLGNARGCATLDEVVRESDFLTLHVPETPQTRQMIGTAELARMKKGSFLLNASRGTVVDIPALAHALKSKHLAGAAIDVYPEEPESNINDFITELQTLENVILTPHIGGATEEAQCNIGEEVPTTLIRFINTGATTGAVNFPVLDLPPTRNSHRILNVHKNVPGVLREINRIVSDLGANIEAQTLATDGEIGYLVLDTNKELSLEIKNAIEGLKTSIRTRILY
ncbi:MAG: phosphoglycerate dehydrogenase [Oligoflexia bacterium]|nr:phosphoglycerate dehydrogenase [Oligoflexia bacterium]